MGPWHIKNSGPPTHLEAISMKPKIGRNDPCSCGSGNKYKRCCMYKRQMPPAEMLADSHAQPEMHLEDRPSETRVISEVALADASRLRTELAEAESSLLVHLELYSWLGNEAAMALAYGNLGYLYEQLGDPEAAEAMYAEASKLDVTVGCPT
jgi:tetratricopeptide (TPR) repeat protein